MNDLEVTRLLHEERDCLEEAFVEEMLTLNSSNHRERIDKEHKLKAYLVNHQDCSRRLHGIYNERIGKRRKLTDNPLDEFYEYLQQILDKNLDVAIEHPLTDDPENNDGDDVTAATLTKKSVVLFTDEESYGKYLDLHESYQEFCQFMRVDYVNFLKDFDNPSKVDPKLKTTQAYKNYLEKIVNYFRDYSCRAKPLFDYKGVEKKTTAEFLENWKKERINLENVDSWQELSSLGLEPLKRELKARGLKCGGTLEDRAKRLFSIRGLKDDQIDKSLKAPSSKNIVKETSSPLSSEPYYLASLESLVVMYGDYYNEHRLATIENVQRKQSRTAEERDESDEDGSDVDLDLSNDNQGPVYNPKNLPLGWDGKPIPYWLYKLHGLNLSYSCEICGNAVYKGPKTFQRHFAEWRHAQGMAALGIPNTAHFANITKIQDAIVLWEKLKAEKEKNKFQASVEEEFEDSQGNVVNRKTYEDLKRQGLL